MKLAREKRGREPDLFFMPKAKISQITSGDFDGLGDLVIKIISPESISRDREDKFAEYQRGGVPEFWLIDPAAQHVNSFQLNENRRFQDSVPDARGIHHSGGLPGFWLRVDWLWQSPSPAMSIVRKALGLP